MKAYFFSWLFALVSLLVAGAAWAEDYYWFSQHEKLSDSNPDSLCETLRDLYVSRGNTITSPINVRVDNATTRTCTFDFKNSAGRGYIAVIPMVLLGDKCPSGATLDPATGRCITDDKCESTVGVEVTHRHRAGDFTGAGVIGNHTPPPGVLCQDSCQYAFTSKPPTRAYRFQNGDPAGVFTDLLYRGNGVSCTGTDDPLEKPSDSAPSMNQQSDCTNKVVHADGSQTYDCRTSVVDIEPGNMDCSLGTVGSDLRCIPKSPKPSLNDKQVDQQITEKTNPDGSKDTTTTTTTTNTSCSGANSCNTTTTTNTTNQHTNPDGSPGPESTACKGPGCKTNEGDKNKDDEEEEKDESKVTGGDKCDVAPACEGDAVQCAILKQQYEARCDFEEAHDFKKKKDEIEGLLEGEKFTVDEGGSDIDAPSFINKGTRFLPAACPNDQSFSLTTGGGRSFALSYEPLCRAASDLSGLFVAVTGIFCALYVGRSVGGQ
jgi:hypothetical protein